MNGWLFGGGVFPYRLVQFLLHALSSLLVLAIGRGLGAGLSTSTLAGCLWAVHPAASTAVLFIGTANEQLVTVPTLASVALFLAGLRGGRRALLLGSAALFGVGLLAKETAAPTPFVCLAAAWSARLRRPLRALVPHLVLLLLYGSFRLWTWSETGAFGQISGRYASPGALALDVLVRPWVEGTLAVNREGSERWFDPRIPIGLCAALALAGIFRRPLAPASAYGCSHTLLFALPAAGFLGDFENPIPHWRLYQTSVGVAFLIAAGAAAIPRVRARRAFAGFALLSLLAGTAVNRMCWWEARSETRAFREAVRAAKPGGPAPDRYVVAVVGAPRRIFGIPTGWDARTLWAVDWGLPRETWERPVRERGVAVYDAIPVRAFLFPDAEAALAAAPGGPTSDVIALVWNPADRKLAPLTAGR